MTRFRPGDLLRVVDATPPVRKFCSPIKRMPFSNGDRVTCVRASAAGPVVVTGHDGCWRGQRFELVERDR